MSEVVTMPDEPHTSEATKGERTRQRLLELAIDQFGERGYRTTSVSAIARAAGLTQAAAYAYFDNKEALFDAAVDEDASAIINRARHEAEGVDVHALFPTLMISVLSTLDKHPLAARVLGGEEREQLNRLLNLPALAELTAWIADEVEVAQTEGRARDDIDPIVFADGFEAQLLGLLMAIVQIGGTTQPRRQLGVLMLWDRVLRIPEPQQDWGRPAAQD